MKQLTGTSVQFLVAITVKITGRAEIHTHPYMLVTLKELYCQLNVYDILCI